jgi:hypothetical protein
LDLKAPLEFDLHINKLMNNMRQIFSFSAGFLPRRIFLSNGKGREVSAVSTITAHRVTLLWCSLGSRAGKVGGMLRWPGFEGKNIPGKSPYE